MTSEHSGATVTLKRVFLAEVAHDDALDEVFADCLIDLAEDAGGFIDHTGYTVCFGITEPTNLHEIARVVDDAFMNMPPARTVSVEIALNEWLATETDPNGFSLELR